ncbi:VOC family protein [Paenibacillus sp. ACRRX]|uniref:VOC family protein n=1 Tax=Paenibacillus sp. ACRRX TaxID=2918206 RepID=UPI001EF4AEB1|nr:VOC family protein [Paenibacillus sp. ACRRX]MCG7409946.1 VOC family protein [Paenibacillus sp. ACRRX]
MTAANPILNEISNVFIPVSNIEAARDWYCTLLGLSVECDIIGGHLCSLPMRDGTGIILDTMPMWGGKAPGGPPTYQTPAVMLKTDDIYASFAYMQERGIELVTEIENGHWFVFKDPDGNLLMICA